MGLTEQYYAFRRVAAAQIRKLLLQPGTRRRICVGAIALEQSMLKTQAHFGKPPLLHEAIERVRVPAQIMRQSKHPGDGAVVHVGQSLVAKPRPTAGFVQTGLLDASGSWSDTRPARLIGRT